MAMAMAMESDAPLLCEPTKSAPEAHAISSESGAIPASVIGSARRVDEARSQPL